MGSKHWTRGDVIALALHSCVHCHGLGLRPGRGDAQTVCNCVLRKIFTLVFAKFEKCSERASFQARVSFDRPGTTRRPGSFSFRNEEFLADFVLLSRRTLGGFDSRQWRLFKYHYLLGADWKLCTRKLGLKRGEFFHAVYRIQQQLGRAYKETSPYGLWPLDEYFASDRRADVHPIFRVDVAPAPPSPAPRRFPLAA